MDAAEFNQQYAEVVTKPLVKLGFQLRGQSLFRMESQAVLALLRFQRKSSGFLRMTHFVVPVRHTFLRTLEKEPAKPFLTEPSEYPFKLRVSDLSREMLRTWHYQPSNLGHWKYDSIHFGDLTDACETLSELRDRITQFGIVWMEHLTPAEALSQIRRHGEDAYCEKIWIEDYETVLSQASAPAGMPSIR